MQEWQSDSSVVLVPFFFFQAEDGILDRTVTGVQTCALPISAAPTIAAMTRRSGFVARSRLRHGRDRWSGGASRHACRREGGQETAPREQGRDRKSVV